MCYVFFFNDTATTEIYTLSLHDALPISHIFFGILAVAVQVAVFRLSRDDSIHLRICFIGGISLNICHLVYFVRLPHAIVRIAVERSQLLAFDHAEDKAFELTVSLCLHLRDGGNLLERTFVVRERQVGAPVPVFRTYRSGSQRNLNTSVSDFARIAQQSVPTGINGLFYFHQHTLRQFVVQVDAGGNTSAEEREVESRIPLVVTFPL